MCQFSHFYLLSSGVKYVCIVAAISRTFSSYNAKVLYPESNYALPSSVPLPTLATPGWFNYFLFS